MKQILLALILAAVVVSLGMGGTLASWVENDSGSSTPLKLKSGNLTKLGVTGGGKTGKTTPTYTLRVTSITGLMI